MAQSTRRVELIYSDLTYKIIGVLFDVYNTLGYGQSERTYQKAIAKALRSCGLSFQEQVYSPLLYKNVMVGQNYFDFLIEKKVVLELKKGNRFAKSHIDQLYRYLTGAKLQLGLLAYFAPNKLHFKRIVNL